ncbi:MAG TPA: hypothetical protein PKW75_04275, partial [candidate division Zixibacteria bacterium]|nr:hypothetical protein [candidate division Zixibacteria bacterium]
MSEKDTALGQDESRAEAGSSNPIAKKDRMRIPRQKMPEQQAEVRVGNFKEVPFGFTIDLA